MKNCSLNKWDNKQLCLESTYVHIYKLLAGLVKPTCYHSLVSHGNAVGWHPFIGTGSLWTVCTVCTTPWHSNLQKKLPHAYVFFGHCLRPFPFVHLVDIVSVQHLWLSLNSNQRGWDYDVGFSCKPQTFCVILLSFKVFLQVAHLTHVRCLNTPLSNKKLPHGDFKTKT